MIVLHGMHVPFVKKMLNLWSTCSRIIPTDWRDLVKLVMESGPQLQQTIWFKKEAKTFEQESSSRNIEIFQD